MVIKINKVKYYQSWLLVLRSKVLLVSSYQHELAVEAHRRIFASTFVAAVIKVGRSN